MRRFTISPEDNGIRLNRYLLRIAPNLSSGLMHKFLRTKHIKNNGSRCDASTRLQSGDTLELYIDDSFFAEKSVPKWLLAAKPLQILYEDVNIAVLYKPAGLLSHSTKDDYGDSLLLRFHQYLYKKGAYCPDDTVAFAPALCNRLDRGTEGLVIAAKTFVGLQAMNRAIKGQRVEKSYLCVGCGSPPQNGSYTAYLYKNERVNRVSISEKELPKSKKIVTAFQTISQKDGLSLIEVHLVTGRSHQIRAHLAFLGCPILGDKKYGHPSANKLHSLSRQALCAFRITFKLDPNLDEDLLSLNHHSVTLDHVWFVQKYFNGCLSPAADNLPSNSRRR